MAYNLILVLPMVWFGFTAPHTALAIATSLSAWQQAFMLYQKLKQTNIYSCSAELVAFAKRIIIAWLILIVVVWLIRSGDWHALSASARSLKLLGIIGASAAAYTVALFALGIRPKDLASP